MFQNILRNNLNLILHIIELMRYALQHPKPQKKSGILVDLGPQYWPGQFLTTNRVNVSNTGVVTGATSMVPAESPSDMNKTRQVKITCRNSNGGNNLMALTYAQMLTKVRDYTEVDSTVLTDAIVDQFILDAEAQIYRECDGDYCREQSTF